LTRLIEAEVELVTCGVVIAEFFQGIHKTETLPELNHHFRLLSYLTPREPESYLAAAALFRALRGQGITIRSTIDCLIACLAEENNVSLLAKDRDIHMILASGLCRAQGLSEPESSDG